MPAGPVLLNGQASLGISFTALANPPITVTATEANYAGTFSATPVQPICSLTASISPTSGSTGAFTVTPLGAGVCDFTISGAAGQSADLTVTVTTTSGSIH